MFCATIMNDYWQREQILQPLHSLLATRIHLCFITSVFKSLRAVKVLSSWWAVWPKGWHCLIQWITCKSAERIGLNFGTNIHVPLWMKSNYFDDLLQIRPSVGLCNRCVNILSWLIIALDSAYSYTMIWNKGNLLTVFCCILGPGHLCPTIH